MAMGLTLGIILAVSGGNISKISEAAAGASDSPSGSPGPAAVMSATPSTTGAAVSATPGTTSATPGTTSATPGTTGAAVSATPGTTAAAAAVPPAPSHADGPAAFGQLGDVATAPVDGMGHAINLNQSTAQAAASMNCTLTVPAQPLSAQGLATPWQLGDGCSMANAATEGAFVEATILSPDGQLQVYSPLVITAGTTPAATPTAPTVAPGSQVIIDVGFNGTNLALTGPGAQEGRCVDALGQSLIGQVSACNAVGFYDLANRELANGTLQVSPLGTSLDGQACLDTRNFAVVDQDPSDNVITEYLINGTGQTAQATAANVAGMAGATPLVNGSDNKLLAGFLDKATGCTPFTAPDTTSPAGTEGSQALNELSAQANQQGTIAVVPPNDEMVMVNGAFSIAKTNVYRSLVDQPLLPGNVSATQVAADFCQNLVNIQPARNQLDMASEQNAGSPVPAVGNNLATFMGNRLSMSFVNLGCANFGLTNPVTVTMANGTATAVTYNLTQQVAKVMGATPTASPSPSGAGAGQQNLFSRHHHHQNPSGM